MLILFLVTNYYVQAKNKQFSEEETTNKSLDFFTENKGQISDQFYKNRPDVLFSGKSEGMVYFLRENGISYQFYRVEDWREEAHYGIRQKTLIPDSFSIYRLDITFEDINEEFEILKSGESRDYNNYYLAACPDGVTGVRSYSSVTYKNIYNGIDLKYYENNGLLEYDFIVSPGADNRKIKWKVEGAREILINEKGDLVMKTEFGEITEKAPMAYQNNHSVKVQWQLQGNEVGIELKEYNTTETLIIDPVVQVWGTYYGDELLDEGWSIVMDRTFNLYFTGYAQSMSNIATSGTHKSAKTTFPPDAMLIKFDTNGVRLWGTYYGGDKSETAYSCDVDADSNIYITGKTSSTNAISTPGSHQVNNGGSYDDAFLAKFNSSGLLIWGTYFGGKNKEIGRFCKTDQQANVYLCGFTESDSGISTVGSHQPVFGGLEEGFLAKFNKNGNLLWSTYYGGSGYDDGKACAIDAASNVYLSGISTSTSGISTASGYQSTYSGSVDNYLVKFNSNGVRLWATYYGGPNAEDNWTCNSVMDGILMTGSTGSASMIASPGAFQSDLRGNTDGFLVKFDFSGNRKWATYYGGEAGDDIFFCLSDNDSNIYFSGVTASDSGECIATSGNHQSHLNGQIDGYLVKFNASGNRLWGTYFGGELSEVIYGFTKYKSSIYLTGRTSSHTGIATTGSHQTILIGTNTSDAFLTKFRECFLNYGVSQNGSSLQAIQNNATYQWLNCDNGYTVISGANAQNYTASSNGSYAVVVSRNDCKDTSACFNVTGIGIPENIAEYEVSLFPNPNKGEFQIDFGKIRNDVTISIFNAQGKVIATYFYKSVKNELLNVKLQPGIYLLKIETNRRYTNAVKMIIE